MQNLPLRPERKVRRVENAAPFFPISADALGILRHFQSIANRKSRAGLFDHLFGFIERVDGKSDDIGILTAELVDVSLIVGDLPNAVRSPDAAVEYDHGIFAGQTGRKIQRAAVGQFNAETGKRIAGNELFRHYIPSGIGYLSQRRKVPNDLGTFLP